MTVAAVLELEVMQVPGDIQNDASASSLLLHLWRADMITAIIEIDKDGVVQKLGATDLHQPGSDHCNDDTDNDDGLGVTRKEI